jgi:hypothetical protein
MVVALFQALSWEGEENQKRTVGIWTGYITIQVEGITATVASSITHDGLETVIRTLLERIMGR